MQNELRKNKMFYGSEGSHRTIFNNILLRSMMQGGSNMTGTDLYVKKAALRSSCATLRE